MFGLKVAPRLLSKGQLIGQTRNMSAVSGPPTVHISSAEKAAHGVSIAVGLLAVPAWVLVHVRQYRGME